MGEASRKQRQRSIDWVVVFVLGCVTACIAAGALEDYHEREMLRMEHGSAPSRTDSGSIDHDGGQQ